MKLASFIIQEFKKHRPLNVLLGRELTANVLTLNIEDYSVKSF